MTQSLANLAHIEKCPAQDKALQDLHIMPQHNMLRSYCVVLTHWHDS